MKKTNQNPRTQVNQDVSISVHFDDPIFIQYMVEQLSERRYDIGFCRQNVPDGYTAVETSSVEAFINLTQEISVGTEVVNLPYVNCFLFTSIKAEGGSYRLSFVNSLS